MVKKVRIGPEGRNESRTRAGRIGCDYPRVIIGRQKRLPVSSAVTNTSALALEGAALVSFRERGSEGKDKR